MYEILMTLMHHGDDPDATQYDVDSRVGQIGDIFSAQRGAHEYARKITEIYGVEWRIAPMDGREVWHTICKFPSHAGDATMHLVVQQMHPLIHDEPEELASLLSINSVFTEARRPDAPQIPWKAGI